MKTKTLSTVNVIEFCDGAPIGLTAYPDTKAGNKAAEKQFAAIIRVNGCKASDVEACIENGYYDNCDYATFLTHSN